MNINLIWSLSWRHNHKHTAWKRSRVTSPGPTSWHSSYSSLHPQGPEVGWRLFWLHRIPAWTLTCLQTNNSQPPSPVMLKEISLWWTLTSFCSLCRHSSSVSSISLSANIHTHTQRPNAEKSKEKCNLYPGDIYEYETLAVWSLKMQHFPIVLCVPVWEAPKAEMMLMGCSIISLLPNNLRN